MTIAVVDTEIGGKLIGGAQTFLPGLVSELIGRGNEVHLITKGIPNGKVQRQIEVTGAALYSNLWDASALVDDAAPEFSKWVNDLKPDVFLISTSADMGWVVLPLLDASIATLAIGHSDSPFWSAERATSFPGVIAPCLPWRVIRVSDASSGEIRTPEMLKA